MDWQQYKAAVCEREFSEDERDNTLHTRRVRRDPLRLGNSGKLGKSGRRETPAGPIPGPPGLAGAKRANPPPLASVNACMNAVRIVRMLVGIDGMHKNSAM